MTRISIKASCDATLTERWLYELPAGMTLDDAKRFLDENDLDEVDSAWKLIEVTDEPDNEHDRQIISIEEAAEPHDEVVPATFIVAWTGGLEEPSFAATADEGEAREQFAQWAVEAGQEPGDAVHLLRLDPSTMALTIIDESDSPSRNLRP